MPDFIAGLRKRRTVSGRAHEIACWCALTVLTLIVMTGAGVRLTGSGLGCSDWPRCSGESPLPTNSHAYIEWGNRMITTPTVLFCGLALVFALLRTEYRRDFVRLAGFLVAAVFAQAILGGITVLTHLNAPVVSAHFILSMITMTVAVVLVWRVRRDRSGRPQRPPRDPQVVLAVRLLAAVGAVTVFAGTLVTASGPHSGGEGTGDDVDRLSIFGSDTFRTLITSHARIATLFGILTIAVFAFAWVRRQAWDLLLPLAATSALTGAAGLIGHLQYHVFAYPEDLVWVHVIVVALLWNAISWSLVSSGLGREAQIRDIEAPTAATRPPDLVAS
ncbi:MAG TPA: COX15/CtaA family protein [Baekduia sp.]|nr:COX15/CtaA family protein [Baekduia sp.]